MTPLNTDNFMDFLSTSNSNSTLTFLPSAEALKKIKKFVTLIQAANLELNLYSRKTTETELLIRHFLDCLAAFPLIQNQITANTQIFDLGSGGGFPGILLACYFEKNSVTLCEKSHKKCIYLNQFIKNLGLKNASVSCQPLEKINFTATNPALIVARGFKPLSEILRLMAIKQNPKFPASKMQFALYKGKNISIQQEILDAQKDFQPILQQYKVEVLSLKVPLLEEERHLLVLR